MTNMTDYLVFGNENAEDDELLFSCKIEKNSPNDTKPILIGRWGTGKSALILLQNSKLSQTLKNLDVSLEKIWYLREESIDFGTLSQLKNKHENDPDIFIKSLEELWKVEILRIFSLLLANLKPLYNNTNGDHWDFVLRVAGRIENRKPYWKQLPHLINFFTKRDISESFEKITEAQKEFTDDKLYECVQTCLLDIDYNKEIYPVVAIEPIETPTSALEKTKGLAQMLITSLLNCYHKYFLYSPNYRRKFKLRISIPWHRYVVGDIDFTQKFSQFEGQVTWTKEQLKQFINNRIEYELKRVSRKIQFNKDTPDYWSLLFENKVINGFCEPSIHEDYSFDYFLRHTHYRARDLLRLARICVEEYANNYNVSLNDTLKIQIPAQSIKETFRKIGSRQAEYLITEGSRRFPELVELEKHIAGLPILFTKEDLKKRIDIHLMGTFLHY